MPWAIQGAHWEAGEPLEPPGTDGDADCAHCGARARRGAPAAGPPPRRAPDPGRILLGGPPARVGQSRGTVADLRRVLPTRARGVGGCKTAANGRFTIRRGARASAVVPAPQRRRTMEKFVIEGGYPLSGTVVPAGNKNAALPILAASLLTEEELVIGNVPRIRDVDVDAGAARGPRRERHRGATTTRSSLRADSILTSTEVDAELASRIRASFLLAGPLLARARRGAHAAARRRLHRPPPARPAPRRAARARARRSRSTRGYTMWAPRRPARLRLLHGRGERDGDREHAHGGRADAGHDDDPQRRLRAARAGPRAAAGRDGRARSTASARTSSRCTARRGSAARATTIAPGPHRGRRASWRWRP